MTGQVLSRGWRLLMAQGLALAVGLAASLPLPVRAQSGETLALRDVTLSGRGFRLAAEAIDIAGSSAPRASLEAAVRSGDPDALIDRLGQLGASSVSFTNMRVERTEGGPRAFLGFARLQLTGLSAGRIRQAQGTDGQFGSGPAQPARFATFSANELDAAFLVRLIGGAAQPSDTARPVLRSAVLERLDASPGTGMRVSARRASLSDLRLMPGARAGDFGILGAVEISDIRLATPPRTGQTEPNEIRVKALVIGADRPSPDDVPTRYRARLDEVTVPLRETDTTPSIRNIRALGLDALVVSAALEGSWSPAARELKLERLGVDLPGLGAIAIAGLIANVAPEVFTEIPSAANARWNEAQVRTLSVTIRDNGLFERVVARDARATSRPVPDVRAAFARQASSVVQRMMETVPNRTVPDALMRFVSDPKALTIAVTAKPGASLPLSALLARGGMATLTDRFDITATNR
ncbi:hypothetical protein E8L99_20090 [Phreatobacter aquaticus]|uniref:Uncharacterized protein n=1 Tax=Phreatobacter aquaticus TaxID=2570229 RepID=A0A4D7QQW0_9HYPH|nr:hypothetical protein [Phreatobacter aquaticus]QCK87889.1 hypothetical protein E8L99_20090 [Phreatobacter aquaticus]